MKVLQVIPSLSRAHGGPSNAIWSIASSVAAYGASMSLVATDNDGPGRRLSRESREAMSVAAQGVDVVLHRQTSEFYTTSLPGLLWLANNIRHFDVLHVHALFSFMPVAAAWLARLRGVPYVIRPLGTLGAYGLTVRRPGFKKMSLMLCERPLLRAAAAVHCTSEAERIEVMAVCPTAKTVVIALSVPPFERAADADVRALLGARYGGQVVLFLSRLDRKKNVEVLLDAFALLAAHRPAATLLIAGDGEHDYVASLKARADALGLAEQVIWAGRVDGSTKAAAFTAATVFALPSHSENFGIAAAEALAAGVPCVLSPGVAIADKVAEWGAGEVADMTPRATADALAVYLNSPQARTAASAAAKRLALAEYSTDVMGERLMTLYRGIGRQLNAAIN